jgi:hypothetical protein
MPTRDVPLATSDRLQQFEVLECLSNCMSGPFEYQGRFPGSLRRIDQLVM